MNSSFPRIITLLRKEKNLSQKEAALELGVSQALLSHYEKGARECGLDFVVKAADFYNVSCDYLLGRTAERSFDEAEIDDAKPRGKAAGDIINRRLMYNSMNVIYDQLERVGNRRLTRTLTSYMMIGIYKAFRFLYTANQENPKEFFTIPQNRYIGYSDAVQKKLFTDIEAMTDTDGEEYAEGFNRVRLSPDTLPKEYPKEAPALFNVIQLAESSINKFRR